MSRQVESGLHKRHAGLADAGEVVMAAMAAWWRERGLFCVWIAHTKEPTLDGARPDPPPRFLRDHPKREVALELLAHALFTLERHGARACTPSARASSSACSPSPPA